MSMTMFDLSTPVLVRGLKVLATLLVKGEAHAMAAGVAAKDLLGARLASDMLPLSAQVQNACDTSKFALQRLSGVTGPVFADDETTFAQLQERIAKTIAFLESVEPALIDAGAEREIRLNWTPAGPVFTGKTYLLTFTLPNFYFHVTTAHGILRNQGVKIGKSDYLGPFQHA
jgi:hypothetical protein